MRDGMKILAVMAASAGAVLGAAPAHTATIVAMSVGPFSLPGDQSGVIPAGTFVMGGQTDDFTFSTIGGTYDTLMQLQASRVSTGVAQNVSFDLYRGVPTSGVFVAHSGGTPTAATLLTLTSGSYYLQFTGSISPKELVTGGVTLLQTVPEPAGWSLMLLGVGGLGGLLRLRRREQVAV